MTEYLAGPSQPLASTSTSSSSSSTDPRPAHNSSIDLTFESDEESSPPPTNSSASASTSAPRTAHHPTQARHVPTQGTLIPPNLHPPNQPVISSPLKPPDNQDSDITFTGSNLSSAAAGPSSRPTGGFARYGGREGMSNTPRSPQQLLDRSNSHSFSSSTMPSQADSSTYSSDYTYPSSSRQPRPPWSPSTATSASTTTYPTHSSQPAFAINLNGGSSASSAIDLTDPRIPSPPPAPPPNPDKKPLCIGAIMSRAIMLYPSPAVLIGATPPEGTKDRWDVVHFRGAEMLKVKLKFRAAGHPARRDEPWAAVKSDCIQVTTPGMQTYIGELDNAIGSILSGFIQRGLLRLEGFAQRLQPEAPQFEVRVNVLLFTLPSNVDYIVSGLLQHNLYLLDPIPPYDPSRHADSPVYRNAHGGGDIAMRLYQVSQQRLYAARNAPYGGAYGSGYEMGAAQMEKANQVEVQRRQVDEVFKNLENGNELEHCDPGPFIKTELFDHQRKALTFLLQREQDWSALKKARKYADKRDEKRRRKSADKEANGNDKTKDEEQEKEQEKESEEKAKEKDKGRSLWEGKKDEKGRTRIWLNKITGEEIRTKKGEKPHEGKGAILADDMGLGKTLSVVSLIAATRRSAVKWGKSKIDVPSDSEEEKIKEKKDVKASDIRTKVFGMPTPESDDDSVSGISNGKGKKRKRVDVESPKKATSTRRSKLSRKSRATLLVCPMSTITNWEDQIKEHWYGNVEIVGGSAGIMPPKVVAKRWKPPKKDNDDELSSDDDSDLDTLKVYIYHGPSRRPDPDFIGDFDIVITSYNTLALEYNKQNATSGEDTPATPGSGDDEAALVAAELGDTSLNPRCVKPEVEAEIRVNEVADALRKGKKKGKTCKVGQTEMSPLQAIDWFRVVLDEAHYIKTSTTVASQASCDLEADRRIALTGTPIQNKIEDVWALFRFLRLSPVDDKDTFTKYISGRCKFGDPLGVARLQLVMRCCTLRRTKEMETKEGKRILNLPPRKEMQLWLDLREDERQVYDARISQVKDKVGELKARNELGKNYANVLQEVLRLRQICNHVDLAMSAPVEEDYDGTVMDYGVAVTGIERYGLNQARAVSVVCALKEGDGAVCVGCSFDYGDFFPDIGLGGVEGEGAAVRKMKKGSKGPVLTKCQHMFCPGCFKNQVFSDWGKKLRENSAARECPACSVLLRIPADVIDVIPPDPSGDNSDQPLDQAPKQRAARKKYVRPPGEKPNLSTKMQYLHDELLKASKKNPNSSHYDPFGLDPELEEMDKDGKPLVTKSVVFSQWTTMLDRIGDMLDEVGIKYARLDGTMTRDDRAKACDMLRYDKKTEVLLVSTRAGGVGLNLTAASRCYLVDPYWNPSVESQAIDRIHRMGQTRPVIAVKLMIKDSIEMKLDQIQKKKANLAQLSLKNMSRKELMEQKAEELADLFS